MPRVLAAFPAFHVGHGSGQVVGWLRALRRSSGEGPRADVPRRGREGGVRRRTPVTPDSFRRSSSTRRRGRAAARATMDAKRGTAHWMITFDDGGASALAAASSSPGASGGGTSSSPPTWSAPRASSTGTASGRLARCGHVVGSHSCSHPDRMAACSRDELMDEWSRSGEMLARGLGRPGRPRQRARRALLAERRPHGRGGRLHAPCSTRCRPSAPTGRRLPAHRPLRDPPRHGARLRPRPRRPVDLFPGRVSAAAWALRGAAKRLAGARYEALRRALLGPPLVRERRQVAGAPPDHRAQLGAPCAGASRPRLDPRRGRGRGRTGGSPPPLLAPYIDQSSVRT